MSPQAETRRTPRVTLPVLIGSLGIASVVTGYLLEAIRQRGDCDAGDASPDTLGLSVVLILFVGGLAGIVGLVTAVVVGSRRRWGLARTVRSAVPALTSLVGSVSILLVAGRDPSTWFQYCAT